MHGRRFGAVKPLAPPRVRRGDGCAFARNIACQTPARVPIPVQSSGALRKRGRKCRWRGMISREGMVSFLASPYAMPSQSPIGPSRMRRGGARRSFANSPARPAPAPWHAPTARFLRFPLALSRVRRRGFCCVWRLRLNQSGHAGENQSQPSPPILAKAAITAPDCSPPDWGTVSPVRSMIASQLAAMPSGVRSSSGSAMPGVSVT